MKRLHKKDEKKDLEVQYLGQMCFSKTENFICEYDIVVTWYAIIVLRILVLSNYESPPAA